MSELFQYKTTFNAQLNWDTSQGHVEGAARLDDVAVVQA